MTMDLNADVGEGFGRWEATDREDALIACLTSANVACGAHAGDPSRMRAACASSARHGVIVGAHVGYPDLHGFGRRAMAIAPGELTDSVLGQIGALRACAAVEGLSVRYVKPHGALYHACSDDERTAEAVITGMRALDPALAIVCAPGAVVADAASASAMQVVFEGFADRSYTVEGRLIDRSVPGSTLGGEDAVRQAVTIATTGTALAVDGSTVALDVRTLCVHGDAPGAADLAGRIRDALAAVGVDLRPFVT